MGELCGSEMQETTRPVVGEMLPDPLQTHSVYSLTTGGVSHSSVKTTQGETAGGISSQVASWLFLSQ